MWRWVTRGLVLSFLSLVTSAALAQTDFTGALDLPDPANTQSGIIVVRGWALDPDQIARVELWVDDQFQHNANAGIPRIDVTETHVNWPGIQNLSPGFQTGFLASRFSDGPHTVYVRVVTTTANGVETIHELGRRTININNTVNQAPMGFVDIPDLSGIYNASGSFPVSGWAIDYDGIKQIDVQIDGLNMQPAVYGDIRPDVGNTFPDFPNAKYSAFVANIDTTRVPDGIHTLVVRATDRQGLSTMIGRRVVQIFNSETYLKPFGHLDEPKRDAVLYGTLCGVNPPPLLSPPYNAGAHITPVRGWALDLATRTDLGRVSYVELMVDGVRWASTDNCNWDSYFSAYTNCYGFPRYDVQRYYPTYPDSPRSGFMFTMDVGAMMARGFKAGNHVLKVRVGDQQGTFAELPNRDGIPVWFECSDQTNDFASIGSIDFPSNFDYVTGTVTFQGWAVDENVGVLAVDIFVDGDFLGTAQLGFPRPDVQTVYPYLPNAAKSGWRFTLDTLAAKLQNTRHRLTVQVRDQANHKPTIIGSVDFYVQNLPSTGLPVVDR